MISIIVPCYNEQEALPLFHKEITRVLQEIGESYELLLVNDGSRDSTLDVMRTLAQEDGHVVYDGDAHAPEAVVQPGAAGGEAAQ